MKSPIPRAFKLPALSINWSIPLTLVLIYFLSLTIYLGNGRGIMFVDTGPACHLAMSIIRDGDLDLNELRPVISLLELDYVTKEVNGNLISSYPVGTPVLAAPFYLIGIAFGITPDQYDGLARLEKFASANIAALLSVLFWILLKRRTDASLSLRILLWVAFAFGSSNWIVNSQALWQHGPLQIFLTLSLLTLPRDLSHRHSPWRVALCGLLLGVAGFMRPTGYILIPVWGLYLLIKNWRLAFPFTAGAIIGFIPQVVYNLTYIPRGDGGYFHMIFANEFFRKLTPVDNGLALLFSPSRGLFVFMPYMILLALWLLPPVRKALSRTHHGLLLVGSALAIFIIYLAFEVWWQGWCYGPRFLSDILPFLFLLLVPPLQFIINNSRAVLIPGLIFTFTAVTWSVGVQALGAARYDGGWDHRVMLTPFPDVAWDWKDNIIRDAWTGGANPRATIHAPDYYAVSPGHIYRMGMPESTHFYYSGFYGQEGWGTWSRGAQKAAMHFHFPAGPGKLYLAAMGTGSPYAAARFDIYLNGRRVEKARLRHNAFSDWQKELIEIPLKQNRLTGKLERLEIVSHDARRATPNGRYYGLAIKEMVYVPASQSHRAADLIDAMMKIE